MATPTQLLHQALNQHKAGKLVQAEKLYRNILRFDPQHADALHLLGVAAYQQGRNQQAVDWISRAIAINTRSATYHSNLGAALRAAGCLPEAVSSFRQALALTPENAEIHYNLGNSLKDLQQFDAALESYEQAVKRKPDLAEAYNNMGDSLKQLGRIEEAISAHKQGLQINPRLVEAHFNLGNALRATERLEEALNSYEQTLRLKPDYIEAHVNLGYTLEDLGKMAEAVTCYEQALRIDSDCATAHFNRALAWLRQGDFKRGWTEYEWRWRQNKKGPPEIGLPRWQGEPLAECTILITAEQGIGDEIMFASCIPDVLEQSAGVVVECDSRLVGLFERSFPEAKIVANPVLQFLENENTIHRPDVQIPIASLPRFFRPELKSFPEHHGYLTANPERVAFWRKQFDQLGPGLKVGISWRGGKDPIVRSRRSTTLDQWKPVLSIPDVQFINLQYGYCQAELKAVREQSGIEIHDWEAADPLRNLDDFAAEIAALDLAISADSATVHTAGALGVSVWTLLPFASDWRWLLGRNDSPWYPSMRLFRQTQFGKWDDVFHRVWEELHEYNRVFAQQINSPRNVNSPLKK